MKELIEKINHEDNFEKKEGMLEMFNMINGTRYGLLAGRVVSFENPDASTAEKYAHVHDVWAWL